MHATLREPEPTSDTATDRFLGERRRAGRALAVLRRRDGLTQVELARAIGVEARTIRRIEAGNPMSSYTLDRIAAHFGLRRSWFLREDFEAALMESDPPIEMARAGVDLIAQSGAVGRPTAQLISALVELSKGARGEADRLSIEALDHLKSISMASDGRPNAD